MTLLDKLLRQVGTWRVSDSHPPIEGAWWTIEDVHMTTDQRL